MRNLPGKEFEQKAFELHKKLMPNAQFAYNYKKLGINSNIERQIDFAIFKSDILYDFFIAVECKDHKRTTDIKAVEAFISVIEDVKANMGVMISRKGFSKSAKTLAERKNIELLTLFEDTPIDTGISVACSIIYKRISEYSINVKTHENMGISKTLNMNNLLIYDSEKKLISTLGKIIELNFSKYDHTIQIGSNMFLIENVYINIDSRFYKVDFKIEYIVKGHIKNQSIKIAAIEGFINELTNEIKAKEFEAEPVIILDSAELKRIEFKTIIEPPDMFIINAFIKPKLNMI